MLDPDCFEYRPEFLEAAEATRLLERLWRELDWTQRKIRLFGREQMQPRLVAWYGDPGAVYRYSGLTLQPAAWHPLLRDLRLRLQDACGEPFNSVLAGCAAGFPFAGNSIKSRAKPFVLETTKRSPKKATAGEKLKLIGPSRVSF